MTLVFGEIANFFRRKLAKIADISYHNIDPWFFRAPFRFFQKFQLTLLRRGSTTFCAKNIEASK
jgi:hypothetical protein